MTAFGGNDPGEKEQRISYGFAPTRGVPTRRRVLQGNQLSRVGSHPRNRAVRSHFSAKTLKKGLNQRSLPCVAGPMWSALRRSSMTGGWKAFPNEGQNQNQSDRRIRPQWISQHSRSLLSAGLKSQELTDMLSETAPIHCEDLVKLLIEHAADAQSVSIRKIRTIAS